MCVLSTRSDTIKMNVPKQHQQGIALVIALIFLLVMTLIGITTLRSNVMNEKMTLNAVQREEALEVAEATLIEAETLVENFNTQIQETVLNTRVATAQALQCESTLNGQGGLCVMVEAEPAFDGSKLDQWRDISGDTASNNVWTTDGRHRSLDNPALMNAYNLSTAPKYIIEFMGYSPADGNLDSSGCSAAGAPSSASDQLNAWPYCELDRSIYRITALATVGNYDETRVMLQSTYVVDN